MPFTTGTRPSTDAATAWTWRRHASVAIVSLTVTAADGSGAAWPDVEGGERPIPTLSIGFRIDSVHVVRSLFRFPDPVNETSARLVAAGVILEATLFLVVREGWLLVPLVYGFTARVLTGPTLSPLGQLVTRVVTPRIRGPHRFVPGPPKRFAQGVGFVFSAGAATAWLAGLPALTYVLLGGLVVAASLEALLRVCLGCLVYNRLFGCVDCADISARAGVPATN